MRLSLSSGAADSSGAELLVIPTFEFSKKDNPAALAEVDQAFSGNLRQSAEEEGFKGKAEQQFLFHTQQKLNASRVLLLGLGNKSKFEPEVLRQAVGRAAKMAARVRAKSMAVALPEEAATEALLQAVAEGAVLGAYRFDRYRTTNKEEKNAPALTEVAVVLPSRVSKNKALQAALDLGERIAEAVNHSRDLVNEPAGVMTPGQLAKEAEKVAKEAGLKASIGGRKEIEKLKMGMFLGVAQGSQHEPKLIQLSYIPKDPKQAKKAPLALVGKAITFDSGGLSLKPADSMVDMKTDMAGSAAVLGAMRVIGALKPPFPVHAFIGACENMPSGTAYRPGDVLISRLGKTVEITNTDAEGRLVLGDMLAYAVEHKPFALIDLATLTGAAMVALGHYMTGVFGEHDGSVGQVMDAAKSSGEIMWRLPLNELFRDSLRSDIADMKNSGERWGGASSAALFLKEFVGETPWVHLDIAGPSTSPKERGYFGKGATGVGVRTLVEFVRQRAQG